MDIVVPVLHGLDASRACLDAAVRSGARVIAVCDPPAGATDLDVIAIRNEAPLGFAGCANRGILLRKSDVLLIREDAILPGGLLPRMLERFASSDRIASLESGPFLLLRSWVINSVGALDPRHGLPEWMDRAQRIGMRHELSR